MTVKQHWILARAMIAAAFLLHLSSFLLPMLKLESSSGKVLSGGTSMFYIPLFSIIELFGLLGIATYFGAVLACRQRKTETGIGVFTGSLLLSLTAPALLLPLGGIENIGGLTAATPIDFSLLSGYVVWVISLFCSGIAIHITTNVRWRQLISESK